MPIYDQIQLIYADLVSLNGFEANHGISTATGYSTHISEVGRSSDAQFFDVDVMDSQCRCDGNINEVNEPVYLDEFSSVDANSNKGDGLLDNCGILPSNCLPCLASTIPSIERKRPSSSSPPNNASKKALTKLPFKGREGHGHATLCELKFLKQNSYHYWSLLLLWTYHPLESMELDL